ncbi:MAG: hypothetical protein FWH03_00030 [Firmicutes bacterium]|nr:hypothetical protein [Bacillota bacterium]
MVKEFLKKNWIKIIVSSISLGFVIIYFIVFVDLAKTLSDAIRVLEEYVLFRQQLVWTIAYLFQILFVIAINLYIWLRKRPPLTAEQKEAIEAMRKAADEERERRQSERKAEKITQLEAELEKLKKDE